MKTSFKLKLIEGVFQQEDAKEILMKIYSDKINFHQLKDFSSQERFGKNDEIAQKRIPALQIEIEKLREILSEASDKNKKLQISTEIKIELLDN